MKELTLHPANPGQAGLGWEGSEGGPPGGSTACDKGLNHKTLQLPPQFPDQEPGSLKSHNSSHSSHLPNSPRLSAKSLRTKSSSSLHLAPSQA